MTAKRPITAEDVYNIDHIEDVQVSPDGAWIAYVHVSPDQQSNDYQRYIWVISPDDPQPRQITRGGKDSQPRWSPDGSGLAFVSMRDDRPQIYHLPLNGLGGEARPLTQAPNGAHSPAWSPDGSHIAYLSPMRADERAQEDEKNDANDSAEKTEDAPPDKLALKHQKERREQDEQERLDPFFVWRIPYREGTRFLDGRYHQVYVIPTAEPAKEDKPPQARRLTDADVNHQAPQWSPDGAYLYTGRPNRTDTDEPGFRDASLFRIQASDGSAERLTGDDVVCFMPLPSPDGEWVAFMRRPHGSVAAESIDLCVMPADGGPATVLNKDISLEDYHWLPDSSGLACIVTQDGYATVQRVSRDGGDFVLMAGGDIRATSLGVGPDSALAFAASTTQIPADLYYRAANSDNAQKLTDINRAFLDSVIVQAVHHMDYTNDKGQRIQGWYLLPVGYQEGEQYPLALNIHGGPQVMWSPAERTMWHEWQFHAARGYVVLGTNPRGSDGYGRDFRLANQKNWGPGPMADVLKGVDTLLEKGFVDETRMAVTGGSYGGYLTAWIIGHSERFAAAVAQRGVYNLVNFYGTSDIPALISDVFGAEPWDDQALLWEHSPIAYAQHITTPLLLIHAENDYRVPISEAEQLFAWVRRATDTPVEFWRYPRDGHELSRSGEPRHRVSRLETMVGWFDRYCQPGDEA